MRKVTENEKMVFEFIKDRIEEGYPPTVREICAEFGFKSTSTAHRYINNLTAKGLLEKGNNQNRAIRLTGGNGMKIPLVGTVTAGIPITAIEEITDYISFQPARHYSNPLFALKVRGESMINAAILDGDMVVIEQTPYAENGDIVNKTEYPSVGRILFQIHKRISSSEEGPQPVYIFYMEKADIRQGSQRYPTHNTHPYLSAPYGNPFGV